MPVYNAQQQQIGVVAIGIRTGYHLSGDDRKPMDHLLDYHLAALSGSLGTFFLVRRLKHIMFGFEPYEIANLFEQRDAMLQSIKEGVIAADNQSHITIVNSEAKRLLQLSGSAEDMVLDCASQH